MFVVEVITALVYYYSWDRLDVETHVKVGWIYAGTSWMSLFFINGILTFMLTPGDWGQTNNVWDAFWNPTFWPSLVLRTFVALALAGLYTLLMATLVKDQANREQLIPYTAKWVLYPLIGLIPMAGWYISQLPEETRRWFEGASAPLTMFTVLSGLFTGLILAVLVFAALRQPRNFTWPVAVLVMFMGLLATASTEMVREAIRRPFIIRDYMYSNSIRVVDVQMYQRDGLLSHARWVNRNPHERQNILDTGRAVFELQCQICHTMKGFNGIRQLTATWKERTLYDFLGHMHEVKPFMPPFMGNDEERHALAKWITSLK